MTSAAVTRAFVQLTNSYRVGFVTISPGSPVSNTEFQAIADFDSATKQSWFNIMTSQTVGQSTPLREALSRVGRYYAGRADGINRGMGTGDSTNSKILD